MKKILKGLAWIALFPFMLTYLGWKKNNKIIMGIGIALSVIFIIIGSTDADNSSLSEVSESNETEHAENIEHENNSNQKPEEKDDGEGVDSTDSEEIEETSDSEEISSENDNNENSKEELEEEEELSTEVESDSLSFDATIFEGYTLIEVEGGDQSGIRETNVVVDIGYGDREYWAFTNEYGQLVKVVADEIILQDESIEPVNDDGRYYPDEAKVPGVESSTLDEGHVIADCLGGVANAYNITPQDSTLNRHGDQAYMERGIREAGGCTDFTAIITYPNNETQVPSHYEYTYTLRDNVIVDSFDNVNPDEVNSEIVEEETEQEQDESEFTEGQVKIVALDKRAEYITIENTGTSSIDISGWTVISVKGEQHFIFPKEYILEPGQKYKLTSGDLKGTGDFTMADTTIWNNSSSDPAELYDDNGVLIDRYED